MVSERGKAHALRQRYGDSLLLDRFGETWEVYFFHSLEISEIDRFCVVPHELKPVLLKGEVVGPHVSELDGVMIHTC